MRWYSSNPSLRCAFCIIVPFRLRRRLGQLQGSSIGIDQSQLVCPPFPVMDDLRIAVSLDEGGHLLDRSPSRDVPVIPLAENAIQQARRAEQPHITSMQRRDGPASSHVLARHQKRQRLLPCARQRQQVL